MAQNLLWIIGCCLFLGSVDANDKRNCSNGQPVEAYPATVKNTTQLIAELRKLMKDNKVDAYIVPSEDDHQTEYVAPWFKRRQFISGFEGSAGTAVITMKSSLMWVDGRYHSQAEKELDCGWTIMKSGLKNVPGIKNWIGKNLKGKVVGADPRVISINMKEMWIGGSDVTWKSVDKNLIDEIWKNRPEETKKSLIIQPIKYSGKNFTTKIDNLRRELNSRDVAGIIVNALDDVAWLLNLRGDDIPYNPFFYGYITVDANNITLYVNQAKLTSEVKDHLCPQGRHKKYCVQIKDYNYTVLKEDIVSMAKSVVNNATTKIWITGKSNLFLAEAISKAQQYNGFSPIQLPKSMKNKVELEGLRTANIRDGVAIMEYFVWLQEQIAQKKRVTEMSGQNMLKEFKKKQNNFKSLSFGTISGFGSNGAIIHYKATNATNKEITDQSLYLLDSGAQFPEGSTDITRTIHLGTPTKYQKEMYTYVLQGAIELARAIFPSGTYGRNIDAFAREYLWRQGLGYMHGTGHGIGSYLSIHEGPGRINKGRVPDGEEAMYEGMVYSDEPGYYEDGNFGIRLETAVVVSKRKLKYDHFPKEFYGFDILTYVPFERKLINVEMLDDNQIKWLNNFNKKTREIMGPEIKKQKKNNVYEYMMIQTEPFSKKPSGSSRMSCCFLALIASLILSILTVSPL